MFDLSHPITPGMTVYPGDPQVSFSSALTLTDDGTRVTSIKMGSHTGTHLDAPSHTVAGGRTTSEISLTELYGEALILRVANVKPQEALSSSSLRLERFESVPKIVIIDTGWAQHFHTAQYLEHPYLTTEAASRLCELGMHVLAIDTLSPDRTALLDNEKQHHGSQNGEAEFPVHQLLLGSDRLIVENLCGLNKVADRITVGFFPLNLADSDGAPVRAVAFG